MNQNLYNTQSKIVGMKVTHLIMPFMLVVAFTATLFFAQTAIAQEVLVQTGFEEFTIGEPPTDWDVAGNQLQITGDTVKNGAKSLGILGGANDDRVGVAIETDNPVISVEFWVYIESGGRSFNFRVLSSENLNQNSGAVYVNWDANIVRLYDGAAWQKIEDFDTDTWKYVRVVADVSESEFDFYAGDNRNEALKAKGKKELAFRNAAENPVAKWVSFQVYTIAAPGYVDDLLIYEGDEPRNLAVVEPTDKLATVWGHIKRRASF